MVRKSVYALAALLAGFGATLAGPARSDAAAPAEACVTGPKLVPTCNVLWGAAAGGFTGKPRDEEHRAWERTSGRTATIFDRGPRSSVGTTVR